MYCFLSIAFDHEGPNHLPPDIFSAKKEYTVEHGNDRDSEICLTKKANESTATGRHRNWTLFAVVSKELEGNLSNMLLFSFEPKKEDTLASELQTHTMLYLMANQRLSITKEEWTKKKVEQLASTLATSATAAALPIMERPGQP
ncbi:unnamed protein product [Sphenostylis stenocarpa]|uniref:Uncharacterized protein n=1 Tax=Sphenostylis stenocarpa TaxID=92480 RepID=A0AA86S9L6_9FABA|nr:unnamed protein product [Sphenostylis stenocarpa]